MTPRASRRWMRMYLYELFSHGKRRSRYGMMRIEAVEFRRDEEERRRGRARIRYCNSLPRSRFRSVEKKNIFL